MTGVYIHVPFCRSKCDYCDFYSLPAASVSEDFISAYVDALKQEIAGRRALPSAKIDSVYFGGGSPSMLGAAALGGLLDTVAARYDVVPDCEISIEMNPEDIGLMPALKTAGFNRFTLGVQTLSVNLHKEIGRAREFCTGRHLDEFFSLPDVTRGVDLIIGIPGQSPAMLTEDLRIAETYRPEHISAYTLTIEEGTPLARRAAQTSALGNLQRRALLQTAETLAEAGYSRYEISNYCLPRRASSHNMKYWTFAPYISFGAGGHSFYGGKRFIHKNDAAAYIREPLAPLEEDVRSENGAMAEFIMTGLRLIAGFALKDFEAVFGRPLPSRLAARAEEEADRGNLCIEGEGGEARMRLTEQGLLFADGVIFRLTEDLL